MSNAALAVLVWRRGLHRWYPVFWVYLILAALSGLSWNPTDAAWGRSVWLYMQPIMLAARALVAIECFGRLTSRIYPREGRYLLGMALAAAGGSLLFSLYSPRADWFGSFLVARQYYYLALVIFLTTVRGYFWVRPADTCPSTRAHGVILAIHFGFLFIGATSAKTGLAWLLVARTLTNWQAIDLLATGGCILCAALWALRLKTSRAPA